MTLLVPSVGEVQMLTLIVTPTLTLKLFSNNKTPAAGDVASDYTVVAGGGYANQSLTFAHWGITSGNPSIALYDDFVNFNFTGSTTAPGTIYGYFIINAGGILLWAERFDPADVPFTPVNGSLISVKPRLTLDNA